ncbi:MAG: DNA/RNA non-specific endonuclease [Eubacteriales bacterium]|nr:DNA/RNA non-specific endonuclease [Eubacteriales bacterium]
MNIQRKRQGSGLLILGAVLLLCLRSRCVQGVTLSEIPAYSGEPYVEIQGNRADFEETDLTTESFEFYSALDSLGRCGAAYANICEELMPTEERGAIGPVKPSGWHTVKYDVIEDRYLYNRCHLIGYQLSGENANELNLITGTRYMNVSGMLPFENKVYDYVTETDHHVLYRVTPVYEGDDLVARGVEMEAKSVEDHGEGLEFHVYCYNVQPGIVIDYSTGDSALGDGSAGEVSEAAAGNETQKGAEQSDFSRDSEAWASSQENEESTYILNTNTKRFHLPSCSSVGQMKEKNKQEFTGSRETLMKDMHYEPCGNCHP